MKTFLSILGGLGAVSPVAALVYGILVNPQILGLALAVLSGVALTIFVFYLGYTFVRDVILGGR